MKRGYKPARAESEEVNSLLVEIEALSELRREVLARIDTVPPRQVTATELKRDVDFSPSAIRLLDRSGWLTVHRNGQRRKYDLPAVLRLAVQLPGLTSVQRVRVRRRRGNIVSVQRETVQRIARGF